MTASAQEVLDHFRRQLAEAMLMPAELLRQPSPERQAWLQRRELETYALRRQIAQMEADQAAIASLFEPARIKAALFPGQNS